MFAPEMKVVEFDLTDVITTSVDACSENWETDCFDD